MPTQRAETDASRLEIIPFLARVVFHIESGPLGEGERTGAGEAVHHCLLWTVPGNDRGQVRVGWGALEALRGGDGTKEGRVDPKDLSARRFSE